MSRYWWGDAPRITIPVEVHPKQKLGAPAARVFGALAMRADNCSGLVDSTIKQIAQDAEMGESQVKVGLKALVTSGYVTQVRHGNSRLSNRYQLHGSPMGSNQPEIRPVNQPEIRPVQPESDTKADHVEDAASDQQGSRAEQPENRPVDPNGAAGNPSQTSRNSDHPLISSLGTTTTSPASSGAETADHEDDGLLPGLMAVASEPKTASRTRGSRYAYTAEFEAFWAAYPMRRGKKEGKYSASQQWAKAVRLAPVESLMAAVKAYAASCGDLPKDAERWLRGRLWEDHVDAAHRAQAGELTDAEIVDILGPDSYWTPPPYPPGVLPGSPQAKAQRARDLDERRAERHAEALTRLNRRSAS